jgi:segregation and condensation protein B
MERDLVKCVGRKEVVGRPMLFGTSDEFLKVFNLNSIKELPPLESFQPAPEAMQGAREKIEGENDEVDIEQYISDNTEEANLPAGEQAELKSEEEEISVEGFENPIIEAGPSEILDDTVNDESTEEAALEGASAGELDDDDFEEIANVMADDEVDSEETLMGATSVAGSAEIEEPTSDEALQTSPIDSNDNELEL